MNLSGRTKARLAVAGALGAIAISLYVSPLRSWLTAENLSAAIRQIATLWYAPLLFMAAFAVSCVLWIPASVFLIAAGVIWGWKLGSLYAILGALIGAVMSYYVSRFIGADAMTRFGGAKASRYLERAGFQTMLILRLIPLFPFAVLNYGAGIAGVRARDFFLSTAIGVAPSMIVVCYSADAITRGMMSREEALKALLKVGFILAALVSVPILLKNRAARALHIEAQDEPAQER
ncbi:MAG: TVP38/TMEM64 family protein [Acidobacteria bacterium]|nr:TVP38/TMEM64 family protein [Acidobacteriota bacterium]